MPSRATPSMAPPGLTSTPLAPPCRVIPPEAIDVVALDPVVFHARAVFAHEHETRGAGPSFARRVRGIADHVVVGAGGETTCGGRTIEKIVKGIHHVDGEHAIAGAGTAAQERQAVVDDAHIFRSAGFGLER